MEKATMQEKALIEGVIWKQLLIFFFPIVFGTFFQQLYTIADAIIVGNFVGTEALAAVGGTTGTLINLVVGFFIGLSIGASVIISQYYGAGDSQNVSKSVHTAIALGTVGGGVLTLVGIIGAPIVLRLMNVPDDIMIHSLTYIRIYFLGLIPLALYNFSSGILRAIGDSKRPLYYLAIACIINIFLDIVFVAFFHWGIAGVAWATIISQTISAFLSCRVLIRSKTSYQLIIKKIRFNKYILLRTIKIGIPIGIQSVMYALSNIIIQISVNQFGTNVIAAAAVFEKIEGLFWMIMGACGVSITTFVGQNFGAKRYDRVYKSVKIAIIIGIGIAVVFSIVLILFGSYIFRIFTDNKIVIQKGMEILYLIVPFYFTFVFTEVFSGALRGAGDAINPSIITFVSICVFRVIWQFFVLPSALDIRIIMVCYPISWIISAIAFIIYYKSGGWIKRNMPST